MVLACVDLGGNCSGEKWNCREGHGMCSLSIFYIGCIWGTGRTPVYQHQLSPMALRPAQCPPPCRRQGHLGMALQLPNHPGRLHLRPRDAPSSAAGTV